MMQELIVLEHLKKELTCTVAMEVPHPSPDSFVVVEKLGSSNQNMVQHASFAIQSYAKSMYEAAVLNDKVKEAMAKLIESPLISAVDLDSDYNYTDTTTKQYRYQAVYDLVFF